MALKTRVMLTGKGGRKIGCESSFWRVSGRNDGVGGGLSAE